MEFFDRTKWILFNPKKEWTVIEAEDKPHVKVLLEHLLILAVIPVVAILVSYLLSDDPEYQFKFGVIRAAMQFVAIVGGAYCTAAVIYAFAEQFGCEKDFNRTFALAAYSYTPLGIAGLFYFYIPLAWIVPYLGLYGFYLLYLGVELQLKPSNEKKTLCFIFSLIVMLVVWVLFYKFVSEIIISIFK